MSGGEEAPAWAADLPSPDAKTATVDKPAWADHLDEVAPVVKTAPPKPAPTRFHAAATPTAEPELSWEDTGRQAIQNAIPSTIGAGKAMWEGLTHPIKTAKAVGELGEGLISQGVGATGAHQDPEEKARVEKLARAMEDHYAQTYGSVKGFKKAVATDPASIALDASTVLDGAGAAAKVAGLEKTAALISKVNPVNAAVRVASAPVKAIARGVSSTATGVPASLMKVATQAGSTSNPALRGAFLKFFTGQGDASEYLQTAQNALGQVREDASNAYLGKKATLANTAPSFKPVEDAIAKARQETMRGGVNVGQFKEANQALDDVQAMVDGWKAANSPDYRSLLGFDNLKQAIWDLRDSTGNAVAQKHLGGVYNGVKRAIVDVDPEYAKLMEQYQTGRNSINDIQRTLMGAGANPAATLAMAKSLRALKTPTGKNLLGQLAEKEPTLPFMLAGNALHPWGAGGKAGLFEGMTSLPLAIATGAISHSPVLGAAQYAAQVAGQSPKVAGAVNFGAGALSRLTPAARAAYYAGRAGQEGDQTSGSPVSASDDDIDLATRMVLAEAGNQPDVGKAAVIHTALNRSRLSGRPLGDIISQPNAFEGVTNGNAAKIKAGTPEYQHAREIVERAMKGEDDPTGGATYFLNKKLQLKEGRKIPSWAAGRGEDIGDHTFYTLPFGRAGRKFGGRTRLSHDQLVERLMKLARQAKRGEIEKTEPLLRVPDETVARALEVAQRAI